MSSNSERALALSEQGRPLTSDTPEHERFISEQFRVVARKWADAENAAAILEGTKADVLEKIKADIIGTSDMKENKAERLARCSPRWEEFKTSMFAAQNEARILKLKLEYVRMLFAEQQSVEANKRHEARLTR